MQLKEFLSIADAVRTEEVGPMAHLTQAYWEARAAGHRGLRQEDVEPQHVECLIELFSFDCGAGLYVHPQIDNLFTLSGEKARPFITEEQFEAFWKLFPRKVAKANARKSWMRLVKTADVADKAIAALKAHAAHYRWDDPDRQQFVPHAATWINQQRWDDELPQATPSVPPRGRMATFTDALAGVV